jgi:transposase
MEDCLAPTLEPLALFRAKFLPFISGFWSLISAHDYATRYKGGKNEYLPPYSPDLNPVEKRWSKVKGYLRKERERSEEALFEAIGAALRTVTAQDTQGWFKYCRY